MLCARDRHFGAFILILSRLTGYYFRVINSYCIQYGCKLAGLAIILYNNNIIVVENKLPSCSVARDTHFSAFIHGLISDTCVTSIHEG